MGSNEFNLDIILKDVLYVMQYPTTLYVCNLQKALYGMKQSPCAWIIRPLKAIQKQGCMQAQANCTILYRHREGKISILIVYVTDIIP